MPFKNHYGTYNTEAATVKKSMHNERYYTARPPERTERKMSTWTRDMGENEDYRKSGVRGQTQQQQPRKQEREKRKKNEWKHPGIETRGGVSSIAFQVLASHEVSPSKGTPKQLRED